MHIKLEKASGRAICRHEACKSKPEYINERGCIKKDTTCAAISMSSSAGDHISYYCRDCIDLVYEDVRKILNPKLWIFH